MARAYKHRQGGPLPKALNPTPPTRAHSRLGEGAAAKDLSRSKLQSLPLSRVGRGGP